MKILISSLLLTFLFASHAEVTSPTKNLYISSAMSLKDVMTFFKNQFEIKYPHTHIHLNLGASGLLKNQIIEGAPVDLFIPASPEDILQLKTKDLVDKNSEKIVAHNQLVFITKKRKEKSERDIKKLDDLKKGSIVKVAMGNPKTVPAGRYAEESLKSQGLLTSVKKKAIYTENVRQVVDLVIRDEVDGGFVFFSDTVDQQDIQIIETIPDTNHSPIDYPAIIVKSSKMKDLAQKFIGWISSEEQKPIWKKYGFNHQ